MPIKVIDRRTQQEVEVDSAEAQRGILQGDYAVPTGELRVKREGNRTGSVDPGDLADALAQGWQLADDEEVARAQVMREESDLGSTVLGSAEAVARGATLGGTDWIAQQLGGDMERATARREGLGGAATALELGGAIAPGLLTGGSGAGVGLARAGSAARTAATLVPAGGVARGGAMVERGLQAALVSAPGLVRTAVPLAGRGAVEAFAFGAGQEVSEAALGDREVVADDLFAAGGAAALLGAGVGGFLPLAGAGLARAARPLTKAGREVLARAGGAVDNLATPEMTTAALKRGGVGDDVAERLGVSTATPEDAAFAQQILTNEGKVLEEIVTDAVGPMERFRAGIARARQVATPTRKAKGIGPLLPTGDEAVERMRQRMMQTLEHSEAVVADRLATHAAEIAGPLKASLLGGHAAVVREAGVILRQARDKMRAAVPAQTRDARGRLLKRDRRQHAIGMYQALDEARQDLFTLQRGLADEAFGLAKNSNARAAHEIVNDLHEEVRKTLVDDAVFGRAAIAQAEEAAAASAGFAARDNLTGASARLLDGRSPLDVADVLAVVRNGSTLRGQTKTELFEEALHKEIAWMQALRRNREMTPEEGAIFDEAIDAAREWAKISERQAKRVQMLDDIRVLKAVQREAMADAGGVLGVDVGAGLGLGLAAATDVIAPGLGAALGGAYALGRKVVQQVSSKPFDNYRKLVALKSGAAKSQAKRIEAVGKFVAKIAGKGARATGRAAKRALPAILPGDRDTQLTSVRKRVANLATNPSMLAETVRKLTSDLDDVAPEVQRALGERMTTAVNYLVQRVPQGYVQPWSNAEPLYDPIALARWERSVEGTLYPIESLGLLESGMYTREHAEALAAVYPQIYEAVQEQIMAAANKSLAEGKHIPQDEATQLSVAFDVPVDPTLPLAGSIARSFANIPADPSVPRPMAKPRKVDVNTNRYLTEQQQLRRETTA